MSIGSMATAESGSLPWINGKRLRVHGAILALCLWSVYAWTVATPGLRDRNGNLKGTDFSHLYTLGSVGLEHRAAALYDEDAQAEITARRIPAAAGIRCVPLYPPQVSIFFAPLAALPYPTALVLWLIASALLYGICCVALWRACPRLRRLPKNDRWTVLLLAIAFPGFFHLIVWGQASAIAFACFTAAFLFLRNERPFLAGLALGCLIFKPQLGIAAAFIFVYTRAWRVIAGAILSASVQLAVPAFYYGADSLRAWARMMSSVLYDVSLAEPRPYQTLSLRTFWTMLVPGRGLSLVLYVFSAIVILGLTAVLWSRRPTLPLALRYSSLLAASVLVAPHLFVYDVVVLAPVFFLLSDWIMAQPPQSVSAIKAVLYLGYLAPLLGASTRWTHLQISVVLMSALVWMIWRAGRTGTPALAKGSLYTIVFSGSP
jgi:hypothetical protein